MEDMADMAEARGDTGFAYLVDELKLQMEENFKIKAENTLLREKLAKLEKPTYEPSDDEKEDDEKEDEKKEDEKKEDDEKKLVPAAKHSKLRRIRENMRVGKVTANNYVYLRDECDTTVPQKNIVNAYKEYLVFHNKPVKDDMTFEEVLEDMKVVLKI
jgi:hypothetical protein